MNGYLLIFIAVWMFGFQFFFNGVYQKYRGASPTSSLLFSLLTGLFGLAALFAVNGFGLRITPFTLLMASFSALNSILYTFCALFALKRSGLARYSLFAMIGGMALPFLFGILFYNEKMTVGKGICFLLVTAAILLTVPRKKHATALSLSALLPCFLIFFFNGASGVLSLIFTNADLPKASSCDYSVLSACVRVGLTFFALLAFRLFSRKREKRTTPAVTGEKKTKNVALTVVSLAACGVLGTVANYFLLLSLADVAGSVQYPLVSGGTIAVGTVLGFFTVKKPTRKDLLATAVAVIGMAALLLPF